MEILMHTSCISFKAVMLISHMLGKSVNRVIIILATEFCFVYRHATSEKDSKAIFHISGFFLTLLFSPFQSIYKDWEISVISLHAWLQQLPTHGQRFSSILLPSPLDPHQILLQPVWHIISFYLQLLQYTSPKENGPIKHIITVLLLYLKNWEFLIIIKKQMFTFSQLSPTFCFTISLFEISDV